MARLLAGRPAGADRLAGLPPAAADVRDPAVRAMVAGLPEVTGGVMPHAPLPAAAPPGLFPRGSHYSCASPDQPGKRDTGGQNSSRNPENQESRRNAGKRDG